MIRFLKKYWPVAVIILLEGILFGANYTPGTYLIGWDNVTPEFDFKTNIIRNIAGVWQEHRGLGLFDGMSHAASTLHTLVLWFLSFVVPQNMLRYTFIFGMHLLGGIGMYALLSFVIPEPRSAILDPNRFSESQRDSGSRHSLRFRLGRNDNATVIALIGAVFYQYSLITIQMFYTPLESFAIHFAYLPWLVWSALRVFETGKRKDYFWFFLIVLLGSTQSFIATLFLPTTILLLIILLCHTFKGTFKGTTLQGVYSNVKKAGILFFFYILCNCYWLLPYVAGIPKNAPVIAGAKINQMSSDENYLLNAAYGNIGNVLTQKGFMFSYQDTTTDGATHFVLEPWIRHLNTPISVLSWVIVAVVMVGFFSALIRPKRATIPFVFIFLLGIFFLAVDTPIISSLNELIRTSVPFMREAYRFPFTKFSIFYLLGYTVLFAYGCQTIAKFMTKKLQTCWYVFIFVLIVTVSLPSFSGHFLYQQMRVTLPPDYQQTFAFFQTQNPNERVSILPQPTYWSWKLYDFGLRGSGFFWYGLPQPTLDRAFDPWSNENENYFWELSYALYKKNPLLLDNVLTKYDVGYLVLDEHLLATATHNRALFIEESKELLSQIPSVSKVAEFGKISVYSRTDKTYMTYTTIKTNLPLISPSYSWTDNDVAYGELGDYIAEDSKQKTENRYAITYPFRSLFTKRSVDEREFEVKETSESATISSTAVPDAAAFTIDKTTALVFDSEKEGVINTKNTAPCYPLKNGVVKATMENNSLRLQGTDNRLCLNFGMPELWHKDGYLVSVTYRPIQGRPLTFALINKTAKHTELETQLQKTENRKQKTETPEWQTDYFILPPLSPDGKGYDVYIANDAIGRQTSINDIMSFRVYTIPYEEMVKTRIQNTEDGEQNENAIKIQVQSVEHPNPAYYRVRIKNNELGIKNNTDTLILSQSFDEGWKAYMLRKCPSFAEASAGRQMLNAKCQIENKIQETFPFLFGKEIKEHVLVNNWANGWTVSKTGDNEQVTENTVILFFLPQLLQWLGFALLPIPFLIFLLKK